MSVVCSNRTINIIRGTSKTLRLTVLDSDGNVVDITSASVYFNVKEAVEDTTSLISKSTGDPTQIDITDPTNGVAEIYLIPSDTQTLEAGRYLYDVWVVLVSGERHSVIQSEFIVESSITIIP